MLNDTMEMRNRVGRVVIKKTKKKKSIFLLGSMAKPLTSNTTYPNFGTL